MKKYLLILIVAIFCLPNIANAQFTSFGIGPTTTWEREMQDQRRFNEKFFGESKAYQSAKKAQKTKKGKVPDYKGEPCC